MSPRRLGQMAPPGRLATLALVAVLLAPATTDASWWDHRTRDLDRAHAPAPASGYRINLASAADHVSQATQYWCIGASIAMMLNIVGVSDDESARAQEQYMRVARGLGPSLREIDHGDSDGSLRGAGSAGWARALTELGAGRYRELAFDGYVEAVRAAAWAIRRTGRPVGLIVWRGAHAWVMTGFSATADPLVDPAFRLTGVYVQDPWFPRVSSIWGQGEKPNSWIPTTDLKKEFLPRRGGRWHAELGGKFVIVAPLPVPPSRDRTRIL